jgi:acylpyruvate hydrolase
MRLVTFRAGGVISLGARVGEEIVDLRLADPELPHGLHGLLELGPAGAERVQWACDKARADARYGLSAVTLLPPVPRPGKILCLGLNYFEHAVEGGLTERPEHPIVFMRSATSLVAHGQPILRPPSSSRLDFEGELVAVIGRRAHRVSQADALDHVAGYSVFNDGSIRDVQMRTSQWTLGKNFDATGGFGPELVTADELPPGAIGLKLETRLNGQVMQSANTTDMIFGVAETVALMSEAMTLEPGDLLVMGTPSGVGFARKPPVWMKAGDVVEVEIEQVGILRNPIADG